MHFEQAGDAARAVEHLIVLEIIANRPEDGQTLGRRVGPVRTVQLAGAGVGVPT